MQERLPKLWKKGGMIDKMPSPVTVTVKDFVMLRPSLSVHFTMAVSGFPFIVSKLVGVAPAASCRPF